MASVLLHNALVLTMDEENTEYQQGYVLVDGNCISQIGPQSQAQNIADKGKYKEVDCRGGILMPGMVNTHTHMSMMVFRSLGDDVNDRLRRYLFPLEKHSMNQKMAVAGAEYAIAELIYGGVTCIYDAYYYEDAIAQAADKAGIRGLFSETILNFPAPGAPQPYGGIALTEQMIERWKGHQRIVPAVFCHALYTNDAQHMQLCHSLARRHGLVFGMHVAEMNYENSDCMRDFGLSPVAYLDSLGILDEHFLAVHAVNVDENDMDILARRGARVSHNPGSNAKGGRSVCPAVQMQERGMVVGLATDGPMSNNTIDLISQLPLVAKIQKLYNKNRCVLPAKDIVRMATIEGARALHLGHMIGSLEVGKRADMIVLETDSVNMNPMYDPYSVLVYSANPANVSLCMVDGEILMQNRQLAKMDFSAVKAGLIGFQAEIAAVAAKL